MKVFHLPDLGEGLPDAEIVEWFVSEGETVKTDQPMVSMETAKAVVDVPVIPKLTPNTDDIGAIARAAEAAGADGFCAINTVGPGYTMAHGEAVLSNGMGGMSGKGVLPIALKCIREVRAVSELPIVGCGGLSSAADVDAALEAGADIVGIGSALTGMDSEEVDELNATQS